MRILLVDDHTLFREALLHVLRQFDGTAVVIEAATAREAIRLAAHYRDLDLILLDLTLPDSNGLCALPELHELRPTVPLVILSASEEASDVRQALGAGAMGYVPKSSGSREMINALRLVLGGEVYVPPALLAVLEALATASIQATAAVAEEKGAGGLTPRQAEVLRLMGQGLSNKGICKRLNVAEGTVKLHVAAVLRALNAGNRTQAVIEATRRGLIPAADSEKAQFGFRPVEMGAPTAVGGYCSGDAELTPKASPAIPSARPSRARAPDSARSAFGTGA